VLEAPGVLPAAPVRQAPVHAHLDKQGIDVALGAEGLPDARALDGAEVQEGRPGEGHGAVQEGEEGRGAVEGEGRAGDKEAGRQQLGRGLVMVVRV
jgi:hypothetical protein